MRLRQVALAARDLDATVSDLCRVLDLEVAFRDPGVAVFGLRNAVLPVGDTFLEVVSPVRPDASAARFLERRGGDAGYMVIVQVDDLAAARARMKRLGVRIVFEHAHEAGHTATVHLHPRDVGGAILSLDASRPPASWDWAGPDWEKHAISGVVQALAGATLEGDDPAGLAAHWAAILDRPASALGGDVFAIALDGAALRFVPSHGRGDGLVGVDLAVLGARARERALAEAARSGLAEGGAIRIAGTALGLVESA
ncbi:MAG TPA: VOC family protein [Myxococcota bacterium]|nr:VOC family protein [Myxococcota bacterium]